MAPNGLHYSFFVSDQQSVALWIGGRDQPPKVVASWNPSPDAKVDVPTNRQRGSITRHSIVAEPERWSGGMPQLVTLQRFTLNADGTSTIQPLVSWHPRGNESGIELRELRLSPDQSQYCRARAPLHRLEPDQRPLRLNRDRQHGRPDPIA